MKQIWCFINTTYNDGDVWVVALTSDGECLAQHISSSVGWAKHDIGIGSHFHHDDYKTASPDGYELSWIDDIRAEDNPQEFKDMLAIAERDKK